MSRNISKLTGKKDKETTHIFSMNYSGSRIQNKKDIVDTFNKYFSEIGKSLSDEIETSDLIYAKFLKQAERKFELVSITVNEVLIELKNLKGNNCTEISAVFLLRYSTNVNNYV